MESEWHYYRGEEQVGPVGLDELARMAQAEELHPNDLVWTVGMSEWQRAGSIREIFPVPPPAFVPPVAPPGTTPGLAIAGLICACVGILCGPLGIIGLILSILGLKEAKKRGGAGIGLAIAGIVVGSVTVAIMVVSIILQVAIFSFSAAGR